MEASAAPPPAEERRPCPSCGGSILVAAVLCRFCGARLERPPVPEAPSAPGWTDLILGVLTIWGFDLILGGAVMAATGREDALTSPGMILVLSLASFGIMSVVVWFFSCRRHGLPIREGLALLRVGPKGTALCLAAGFGLAVVGMVLLGLFSTQRSLMQKILTQPGGLAAISVVALLAPVVEEAYYRGFLYPILERKTNRGVAAVVVVLWFTAAHAFQLKDDPIALVPIAALSVTVTAARAATRSLVPAVLIHGIYNAVLVGASWLGGAKS